MKLPLLGAAKKEAAHESCQCPLILRLKMQRGLGNHLF